MDQQPKGTAESGVTGQSKSDFSRPCVKNVGPQTAEFVKKDPVGDVGDMSSPIRKKNEPVA